MAAALRPMLATLGELPRGDEWVFEVKWDGVRALARVQRSGRARSMVLRSRGGNEITARYPELAGLAEAVPRAALPIELDGEIVAFDREGRPSFAALQSRMHLRDPRRSAALAAEAPVSFAVFDVLEVAGRDVTGEPLERRRVLLDELAIDTPNVHVPPEYEDGEELLGQMVARGMEGVVAKRRSSSYFPGRRGSDWVKVKPKPRQEFVVGGWTEGSGRRTGMIGALMLGYHEAGTAALRYVGNVGSGFDDRALAEVARELDGLASDRSPFDPDTEIPPGGHFVVPQLVAEVEYGEFTSDGRLRHPVFKGLRSDKPADEVTLERSR
ncbi:MAG: non-homologous end-joining DNA ligase [Solirubrobacterales bacterium]